MKALSFQFMRFIAVGMLNTAASLIIIYILMYFTGLEPALANFSGYVVGLSISFALNKVWAFKSSSSTVSSLQRFLVVFAVAYVVNLLVLNMILLIDGMNPYLAQLGGIVPYSITFFTGCRVFAFASPTALGKTTFQRGES